MFLRGFKFRNLHEQLNAENFETPSVKFWIVQSQPYNEKMEAYKAGVSNSNNDLGIYIINENNQWYWLTGAYLTQEDAENVLHSNSNLSSFTCRLYEIDKKKLRISNDVIEPCRQLFNAIGSVIEHLIQLRSNLINDINDNNVVLNLIDKFNTIKSNTEKLQKYNTKLKSDLISCMIYTANQNLLGLQNIVFGNNQINMSTVNTTLLKTIFSVDNF